MRRSLLLAACALAAALPAAGQPLKPGLWEVTARVQDPHMDQAVAEMQRQMAAMPPAQRKQMEEAMAKQGVRMAPAAGGGMAMQVCMTREMTQRNEVPMQEGCRVTSQQRSGNTTRVAASCANPPSTAEGEFTVAGPEAYSSRMTVRTTVQGKAQVMDLETAGKWLAADCGSVRPPGPPAK